MKDIVADTALVGYCGLYCGACGSYLRDRCRGCHENARATWCKVRACCRRTDYSSCGECTLVKDPAQCKKFNNVMSKVIGFALRSDRRACILRIREQGLQNYAEDMALHKRRTIRL